MCAFTRRGLWPLLLAVTLLACDTTEPRARTVSGSWNGYLTLENDEQIGVTLTLSEGDRGQVTGSGVLGPGVFDFSVSVEGVHDQTQVSLTLTTPSDTEFFFLGEWAGEDLLRGQMGGALGGDLELARD